MTDLSAFDRFAGGGGEAKEPYRWTPQPEWEGEVVAFDQTLSATGWACVHSRAGMLTVHRTGMCKTEKTEIKGYGDYMERALVLRRQVRTVLRDTPVAVAFEEPPMGGGLRSPESSLTAGAVVSCVADEMGLPLLMVHGKVAKKRITGDGNAEKKVVRAVLMEVIGGMRTIKPMNDDVSDAIALAAVAFERKPTWL